MGEFIRGWWRKAGCVALIAALVMGCGTRSSQMYSSQFDVLNNYNKEITIHDWTGLDSWCPMEGDFRPGVKKRSTFPHRKEFPESAIVIWSEKGSEVREEHEFDLRGVVPRGVKGTTLFELDADGNWKVQFLRDDDKSPKE